MMETVSTGGDTTQSVLSWRWYAFIFFAAAALVLTHYHLGANQVFEDLKLDL